VGRSSLRPYVTGSDSGAIASYAYTLDASGHRTSVTELSGRTVNYSYDNLYRLTNETIASDPNGVNGAASYVYDPVGNRKQKTSTIPGYPGGLSNYNASDQLATDTYDANGNTTLSTGLGYAYDFENHLIQQGGITYTYDGDGNRRSKTVNGVTTQHIVDTQNPTGYAQVLQEIPSNANPSTYVYGHYSMQYEKGHPNRCAFFVLSNFPMRRPLARRPPEIASTQKMQVQVKHGLPRPTSIIKNCSISGQQLALCRQLRRH